EHPQRWAGGGHRVPRGQADWWVSPVMSSSSIRFVSGTTRRTKTSETSAKNAKTPYSEDSPTFSVIGSNANVTMKLKIQLVAVPLANAMAGRRSGDIVAGMGHRIAPP